MLPHDTASTPPPDDPRLQLPDLPFSLLRQITKEDEEEEIASKEM